MPRARALLWLVLLTAAPGPAASPPLTPPPPKPARATVTVPLVKSAPRLDGELHDRIWQHATEVGPFVLTRGRRMPTQATRAWLAYDDIALYVAFQCRESALVTVKQQAHLVRTEARGHDDLRILRDDTVEVFLEPPGRSYVHFVLSAAGARFEQRGLDPRWNGGWNGATRIGEGEWTAEFVILFESVGGPPLPGAAWGLNLCRQQRPQAEASSWSGLQGGLHQPTQFGSVRFQAGTPLLRELSTGLLPTGEFALTAILRNLYPTARTLQLRGIARAGSELRSAQSTVNLPGTATPTQPAEAPTELRLPVTELAGAVEVQFALIDTGSGQTLSATPPLPIVQASTRVQAALAAAGPAELFLNGQLVSLIAGRADVSLRLGLNVIAVRAQSSEANPWLEGRFQLETLDLRTDEHWRIATRFVERWNQPGFDDAGWPRAKVLGEGRVWAPEATASEVYLRRTLVLSDPEEPAWPHTRELIVPRRSAQMFYPLIEVPSHLLRGPVTLHLEHPPELTVVEAEPNLGAVPTATNSTPSPRGNGVLRTSLRFEALPASGAELRVRYGDLNDDTLKTLPALRLGGTFSWRRWEQTLLSSDRAFSLQPSLAMPPGSSGVVWLDDVVIRDLASGRVLFTEDFEGPQWRQHPAVMTELREGKPSRCLRVVAAAAAPGGGETVSPVLLSPSPIAIEPGARLVFAATARGEGLVAPGPPTRTALLVRLGEASWSEARMLAWFELPDGEIMQVPRVITVRATPPLAGRQPRQLRLLPCYYNDLFASAAVNEALADNLLRSGINLLFGRGTNRILPAVAPHGVRLVYALEWEPWTAAFDRAALMRWPEARAQHAEGRVLSGTICPTYLLQPDCPLLLALRSFLAARIRAQQPAEVNWDFEQATIQPPNFCFCERCLAGFAALAGLVPPPSREQVLGDRALLAKWSDFRCQQNARLIALVRDAVKQVDATLPFSVYSGFHSALTRDRYGVDWTLVAPHVDGALAGYNGTETLIAETLTALNGVPLIGGQMWLESLDLNELGRYDHEGWHRRMLRNLVDTGGRGVLFWWLPTLSGGAFAELAELSNFLTQFEPFLIANQRADALAQLLPASVPRRTVRVLKLGDERLVLLFNESSDPLRVTLKNLGLPRGAIAQVIGETRPRARAEELALTVRPLGFAAVHVSSPKP